MTVDRMNLTAADATVGPEKIGGWLWFPALGLVVGCISLALHLCVGILLVSTIPNKWEVPAGVVAESADARALLLDEHNAKIRKLREVYAAYTASEAALMVLLMYAGARFFGQKRNAPAAMIALLIAQVVVNGLLTAMFFLGDADSAISNSDAAELAKGTFMALAGGVLAAAIWIPYLRVSKRVKRTFVVG